MKSCDGYFYRLGLKMGLAGIMEMVKEFKFNERTGIDLPHELVSWTPSPEFKARFNPSAPEWTDIDTVYASFGQVYDFVTPISLLARNRSRRRRRQLVHASPFKGSAR